MLVKILGMGCIKCNMVGKYLDEVSKELAIDIIIQLDDSIDTFIEYKVESTPSLLINGEVRSFTDEIEKQKLKEFILKHKNIINEKTA